MNRIAQSIKNRLSLRPPQEKSLNILAGLSARLSLEKNADLEKELVSLGSAPNPMKRLDSRIESIRPA